MRWVSWSLKHQIPPSKLQHLAQPEVAECFVARYNSPSNNVPCTWLEVTAEHNIQTLFSVH